MQTIVLPSYLQGHVRGGKYYTFAVETSWTREQILDVFYRIEDSMKVRGSLHSFGTRTKLNQLASVVGFDTKKGRKGPLAVFSYPNESLYDETGEEDDEVIPVIQYLSEIVPAMAREGIDLAIAFARECTTQAPPPAPAAQAPPPAPAAPPAHAEPSGRPQKGKKKSSKHRAHSSSSTTSTSTSSSEKSSTRHRRNPKQRSVSPPRPAMPQYVPSAYGYAPGAQPFPGQPTFAAHMPQMQPHWSMPHSGWQPSMGQQMPQQPYMAQQMPQPSNMGQQMPQQPYMGQQMPQQPYMGQQMPQQPCMGQQMPQQPCMGQQMPLPSNMGQYVPPAAVPAQGQTPVPPAPVKAKKTRTSRKTVPSVPSSAWSDPTLPAGQGLGTSTAAPGWMGQPPMPPMPSSTPASNPQAAWGGAPVPQTPQQPTTTQSSSWGAPASSQPTQNPQQPATTQSSGWGALPTTQPAPCPAPTRSDGWGVSDDESIPSQPQPPRAAAAQPQQGATSQGATQVPWQTW